ncbi:S8 family peptidase [Cytobacillus oceanisediminis]|uniref:S8 family peptidase n=1 Tax=Cytobacillus oceanisediminis TaxID=665099 RepID=UPI003734FD1B
MKKASLMLFTALFLWLPGHSLASSEEGKEWILYFSSILEANNFKQSYPIHVSGQHDDMLKGTFTDGEVERFLQDNEVKFAEPNHIKEASAETVADPLQSQQWALQKIGFQSISEQFSTLPANRLIDKSITASGKTYSYNNQPLYSRDFSIKLNNEKIRRLSVELSQAEGRWTVHISDENNNIIGRNSTNLEKIDILLPKGKTYGTVKIKITSEQEWSQTPYIKQLTGVNSAIVAVIDSGIIKHEDFCGNILYSLGKDYIQGMPFPEDRFGHGTHVTGIIAACHNNGIGISGVAGQAPVDVIPLKVLDHYGNGGDFELSKAISDAADLQVDVINLSLAGKGKTLMLQQTVTEALLKGIPVVAAAGNWNISTENVYPASYPGVITVAGINTANQKVATSNYGWEVDISAPGYDILSTYTSPVYKTLSGTSMAAPYVSGSLALYTLKHPNLDFVEARQILSQSAKDVNKKGYDTVSGDGLLQLTANPIFSHRVDWLTLREGQPINTEKPFMLGFSNKLIGKKYILFKDETLLQKGSVYSMIENISLKNSIFTKRKNPLTVIVANNSNEVIDSSSVHVTNPAAEWQNTTFKDVAEGFWAYTDIKAASEAGIINGYTDQTFKPSANISRRHSLMMIDRLFHYPMAKSVEMAFKDVSLSTPGILSILKGYENDIIRGSNGYLYPEKELTRGQMALILARALGAENKQTAGIHSYKDVSPNMEIYHSVQFLAENNIVAKQEFYRPHEPITRAQFAAMLTRTLYYLK